MELREEIQEEARRWLGTPYRHQHRMRGVAVDCIGVIWGVGEACRALSVDEALVRPYLAYSRLPSPTRFLDALAAFLEPAGDFVMPGDIACMAWDNDHGLPQHVGILCEDRGRPTIIHAESQIGRCVEHGFVGEWPGRVHSWWRYPGVAALEFPV